MLTVTCDESYIESRDGTITLPNHDLAVLASTGQEINANYKEKRRLGVGGETIPVALNVTKAQLSTLQSGGTVTCTPVNRNARYGKVNVVMRQAL